MNNFDKFQTLREKYPTFIYENYQIIENSNNYELQYVFNIPNLTKFYPKITIPKKYVKNKKINKNFVENLVFHIGLVELVSYFKCVCSKEIIIACGHLDDFQINWWKKLYYHGLGEFLFLNNIEIEMDDLINIKCTGEKLNKVQVKDFQGIGNLIPIGGGKDSLVSLELLKENYQINDCFIINPKTIMRKCVEIAGYNDEKILEVQRTIDKNLLKLNEMQYLNGHTPFSALVAFITYLCAYLANKKYIVLSNESSANEPTVLGTKINHQYSKSYEFEEAFNTYVNKYFNIPIKYFSLLRGLSEIQIAKIFSKYSQYHKIFKSCNVGSKNAEWKWCCDCPKCLFVYIMLSPFLTQDNLLNIFGENLLEKTSLLSIFKELLGYCDTKPFECIGTNEEVRLAVSLTILKYNNIKLPYLLQYYKDNYPLYTDDSILYKYNSVNILDENFANIIKGAIKNE